MESTNTKRISLAMPEVLLKRSKKYSEDYGYKNIQEFILDLVRNKVMTENNKRYAKIEARIEKTGKLMSSKEALEYLKNL